MKRRAPSEPDVKYVTAADLIDAAGISRTTLWRWRADGLVPKGSKRRNGALVFTKREADDIQAFARQVTPLGAVAPSRRGRSSV